MNNAMLISILNDLDDIQKRSRTELLTDGVKERLEKSTRAYYEELENCANYLSFQAECRLKKKLREEGKFYDFR